MPSQNSKTGGYSRLAISILASLKAKGFMTAYGARLLTNETMQSLTRAEGYLLITTTAEGTDMASRVVKVETAVDEVIVSIFQTR